MLGADGNKSLGPDIQLQRPERNVCSLCSIILINYFASVFSLANENRGIWSSNNENINFETMRPEILKIVNFFQTLIFSTALWNISQPHTCIVSFKLNDNHPKDFMGTGMCLLFVFEYVIFSVNYRVLWTLCYFKIPLLYKKEKHSQKPLRSVTKHCHVFCSYL